LNIFLLFYYLGWCFAARVYFFDAIRIGAGAFNQNKFDVCCASARMSGAAFDTIVLRVTPDSASGGLLALLRNGDRINLSANRSPGRRGRAQAAALPKVEEKPQRGYARVDAQEILGVDQGCDFAFLKPR
jgi:dihydroxyacid dehydratase/phosphogluconate dehydratase